MNANMPDTPTEEVTDSAGRIWQTVLESVPRLGVALVVVVVGYGLSRLLRWGLAKWFRRRQTPSFSRVMSKVAGYLFFTLALLAAVTIAFPSVQPVDLLAGLGIFSLAVGFAFQDILENTLAGVLLLFRQPFAAGDQITVLERSGTVESITIRETRIVTFDGQLLLIPNRDVYKNVITVQTHFAARRLAFVVGIAYENDALEACRVMARTLPAVDGVLLDPPPDALVRELGVSTVDIEARFWAAPQQLESQQVLHAAIASVKAALDSAGIEMPADIVVLQATPSFKAALRGEGDVTPGGAIVQPQHPAE